MIDKDESYLIKNGWIKSGIDQPITSLWFHKNCSYHSHKQVALLLQKSWDEKNINPLCDYILYISGFVGGSIYQIFKFLIFG